MLWYAPSFVPHNQHAHLRTHSPICSKEVSERLINEHIDSSCKQHAKSSSQGSKNSVDPPSSVSVAPIFQKSHKRKSSEPQTSNPSTSKAAITGDDHVLRPAKRNKHATFEGATPLAEKLRPDSLSQFVGQCHLTGPDSLLIATIPNGGLVGSAIFWGPPG